MADFKPSQVTLDAGTVTVDGGYINASVDGISSTTIKATGSITGVGENTRMTILTKFADDDFMNMSIVSVSGADYAKYFLVINTKDLDIRRSGPDRNLQFDFTGAPIALNYGDIVDVQVEHFVPGQFLDFEATLYGYGIIGWVTELANTIEATLTLNAPTYSIDDDFSGSLLPMALTVEAPTVITVLNETVLPLTLQLFGSLNAPIHVARYDNPSSLALTVAVQQPRALPDVITISSKIDLQRTLWESDFGLGCSANGQIAYACQSTPYYGKTWKTTDYGANWNHVTSLGTGAQFGTVRCSKDGLTVVVGSNTGVWTSANGSSFTQRYPGGGTGNRRIFDSAVNADGSIMYVGIGDYFSTIPGRMYKSTDKGVSWSEVQPAGNVNKDWFWSRCDDSGNKVIVTAMHSYNGDGLAGGVWVSDDAGATWTETFPDGSPQGTKDWRRSTISGDGNVLYSGRWGGRLYRSYDFGSSWTEIQPAGAADKNWYMLDTNYLGNVCAFGAQYDQMPWLSFDYGNTFTQIFPSGVVNYRWGNASLSDSGTFIYLMEQSNKLWTITIT